MAKTLNESAVTTRSARAGLPAGLHWRALDPDVHLGYRKGKRGGNWLVRCRARAGGYKQVALGTADDVLKVGTLDFEGAKKAARLAVEAARAEAAAAAAGPALTVRCAVEQYVESRDARDTRRAGRPKRSDAHQRLGRYVIGQAPRGRKAGVAASSLAEIPLHKLEEKDLEKWRKELPADLKATTCQRLINDLKAALNTAYGSNRGTLPPSLPGVIKHGLRADLREDEADSVARDNQILADERISEIIAAAWTVDQRDGWDGDLARLVIVLATTGARFSQVARMKAGDVQPEARRLLVPVSRKGRGGKSGSIIFPVGQDVIEALEPAIEGKAADAPLLERWRSVQVPGEIRWRKEGRGPWQSPSELTRPWKLIREEAEMPTVIPYALRHSSIVRGIRANLPIRLVAALHDTSTAMIERHYAKWITSGLEELARAAIVPLVR